MENHENIVTPCSVLGLSVLLVAVVGCIGGAPSNSESNSVLDAGLVAGEGEGVSDYDERYAQKQAEQTVKIFTRWVPGPRSRDTSGGARWALFVTIIAEQYPSQSIRVGVYHNDKLIQEVSVELDAQGSVPVMPLGLFTRDATDTDSGWVVRVGLIAKEGQLVWEKQHRLTASPPAERASEWPRVPKVPFEPSR